MGVHNCTVVRDWMHFLILFLTPTFISVSSSAHLLIIILDRWARPLLVWYSDVGSVLAAQSSAVAAACSWVWGGAHPRPVHRVGACLGGAYGPCSFMVFGVVLGQHAKTKKQAWLIRGVASPQTSSGIVWLVRITHHHPIACHSSVTHLKKKTSALRGKQSARSKKMKRGLFARRQTKSEKPLSRR